MKANPERAEVPLTVTRDGVEHEYILFLSIGAARVHERALKKTIGMLIDGFGASDASAICELVFVLLQKFHKVEIRTVEQAADLIDEAGFKQTCEALSELIERNTPNPRKAPAIATAPTTGDASISTPAA